MAESMVDVEVGVAVDDDENDDGGGVGNHACHMLTTFFLRSWAISAARSPFAWVRPRFEAIEGSPTPERLTLKREPKRDADGAAPCPASEASCPVPDSVTSGCVTADGA